MNNGQKNGLIFLLVIMISVLCALVSPLVKQIIPDKKETVKEIEDFTDVKGDFSEVSLFEASEETLKYAGYFKVTGSGECFRKFEGLGFESRQVELTYEREFMDSDNYVGTLNMDIVNSSVAEESSFWSYNYAYYSGALEGKEGSKIIEDGDGEHFRAKDPDILKILFPDISQYETTISDTTMPIGKHGGQVDVYAVSLKGNLSEFTDVLENIVGPIVRPESVTYYFSKSTHILNRVVIYCDGKSGITRNDEKVPLLTIELNVERVENNPRETLSTPVTFK